MVECVVFPDATVVCVVFPDATVICVPFPDATIACVAFPDATVVCDVFPDATVVCDVLIGTKYGMDMIPLDTTAIPPIFGSPQKLIAGKIHQL